jgi:hypothetical protein
MIDFDPGQEHDYDGSDIVNGVSLDNGAHDEPADLCARCGLPLPEPTGILTGYGLNVKDEKICYPCCGELDRADMIATGKAFLYFDGKSSVTNWPGSLRLKAINATVAGQGFQRQQYVRFIGPDNHIWLGRGPSANGTYIRCKRTNQTA